MASRIVWLAPLDERLVLLPDGWPLVVALLAVALVVVADYFAPDHRVRRHYRLEVSMMTQQKLQG